MSENSSNLSDEDIKRIADKIWGGEPGIAELRRAVDELSDNMCKDEPEKINSIQRKGELYVYMVFVALVLILAIIVALRGEPYIAGILGIFACIILIILIAEPDRLQGIIESITDIIPKSQKP